MEGRLTIGETYAVTVPVATLWTSPQAPRDIDRAAVGSDAAARAWVERLGTTERLGLHRRVDSQMLLGEEVMVDEIAGEWARVVVPGQPSTLDPRGYPGWLPIAHLVPVVQSGVASLTPATGSRVVVTALITDAYDDPAGAPLVRDISFGTVLDVDDRQAGHVGGWAPVLLPGMDRSGWLRESDLDTFPVDGVDGQWLADAARVFLGLAYLWGGRSGLGVDCSGLVHLVHQRFGVTIPRDAHDQAAGGAEVDPDRALPGDLYFFAGDGDAITHVAIAAGDGRMLHAPETGRAVELVTMPEDRRRRLVVTRRYWG